MNDTIAEYLGSCQYISGNTNETLSCESFEYTLTDYHSTIITQVVKQKLVKFQFPTLLFILHQWDLVCDRRWMSAFSQSVYMFGCLVAGSILGQLADRYGRWKVLYPCGILTLILTIACGFAPNYIIFVLLQFFISVCVTGAEMTTFILGTGLYI